MNPKQETPEANEERGTGSTNYARFSSRAKGKRMVVAVVIPLLFALILEIVQAKLIPSGCTGVWNGFCSFWFISGIWGGFWVITIVIGVWLIAAIVRVLRKP
jgi:hypothetical protein